jgi:hypothetical protein
MNHLNEQATGAVPPGTAQDQQRDPLEPLFVATQWVVLALGRSLFPISAIVIIGGTVVWGPWVTLVLAFGWFTVVLKWMG